MKEHRSTHLLAFWLAACLCPRDVHAQKLLRWKLEPGQRLHVALVQKSDQQTRGHSRPVTLSVGMTMEMDWIVDDVDRQRTIQLTQSITRLALSMNVAQSQTVEYDSASRVKPAGLAQEIAETVGPLIGTKFQLTMNDRGEIVDVKLSDQAASALARNPATQSLKGLFTKEGLIQTLRQAAVVLPKDPIDVGDQWTVTTNTPSPVGTLQQVHTYTYEGTEQQDGKPLEKIKVDSTLEVSKRNDVAGSRISLTEQQQTGWLLFDAAAGRFVSSQLTQELVTETPYRDLLIRVSINSSLQMVIDEAEHE